MDIRDAFFGEVYRIMLRDKNVYFLTADMGANDLIKIRKDFPDRFYNVGISEQNMVSVAAGLALSGKKVFIYTIAAFLQRCFEQIKVDICGMNLPVVIVGGCVGLSNATDGSTHHSINDITLFRTLPNLTILNPSYGFWAEFSALKGYESTSPVYVRLDKGEFNTNMTDCKKGTVIIATGNMVETAIKAAGEDVGVFDFCQLKPVPEKPLLDYLKDIKRIITLEEHLTCGLGSIIAEFIADHNLNIPFKRLGIDDRPCPVGDREYLQKFYGLDVESIKNAIRR